MGGSALTLTPKDAYAVKAGPKLDQFDEWQALLDSGIIFAALVLHDDCSFAGA